MGSMNEADKIAALATTLLAGFMATATGAKLVMAAAEGYVDDAVELAVLIRRKAGERIADE